MHNRILFWPFEGGLAELGTLFFTEPGPTFTGLETIELDEPKTRSVVPPKYEKVASFHDYEGPWFPARRYSFIS